MIPSVSVYVDRDAGSDTIRKLDSTKSLNLDHKFTFEKSPRFSQLTAQTRVDLRAEDGKFSNTLLGHQSLFVIGNGTYLLVSVTLNLLFTG